MKSEIELFYEPLCIFDEMPEFQQYCEMSEFEQAFLCGCLKKVRPHKVLEVGVSAGGTTAVILKCLSLLGNPVEMYSVDIRDTYYRKPEMPTGFVAAEAWNYIQDDNINHTLLAGRGYLAELLEHIGGGIDFLILDTVHFLPGEMLDFLAAFPYLSTNASVVLHDISYNSAGAEGGYATQVIYSTVAADKYFMWDKNKRIPYPNIGAFSVNEDTKKYMENSFFALTITWSYLPDRRQLQIYHDFLAKKYDPELIEIFEKAVSLQTLIKCRSFKNMDRMMFDEMIEKWKTFKHGFIYGCGHWGITFLALAETIGCVVDCMVISDDREIPKDTDVDAPIRHLRDIDLPLSECFMLLTVAEESNHTVMDELKTRGWTNVY